MDPTHSSSEDMYLEPAVEINREAIDPLGEPLSATQPNINVNICPKGGC